MVLQLKCNYLDEQYIRRCLQLARCGRGSTSPNPMVGAVIVCDNRIIGEGYHIRAGEPHAEVNAVRSVKNLTENCLKNLLFMSLSNLVHTMGKLLLVATL